jgi:hypothetical protein
VTGVVVVSGFGILGGALCLLCCPSFCVDSAVTRDLNGPVMGGRVLYDVHNMVFDNLPHKTKRLSVV